PEILRPESADSILHSAATHWQSSCLTAQPQQLTAGFVGFEVDPGPLLRSYLNTKLSSDMIVRPEDDDKKKDTDTNEPSRRFKLNPEDPPPDYEA
ncbi:hypothetical protein MPER_15917, partial [Moniliophthora perniciosa FA553]